MSMRLFPLWSTIGSKSPAVGRAYGAGVLAASQLAFALFAPLLLVPMIGCCAIHGGGAVLLALLWDASHGSVALVWVGVILTAGAAVLATLTTGDQLLAAERGLAEVDVIALLSVACVWFAGWAALVGAYASCPKGTLPRALGLATCATFVVPLSVATTMVGALVIGLPYTA
jgi:hypothetical protein